MSKFYRGPAISDDADRMGKIAQPSGVEGNADHAQGQGTRANALSGARNALNKQVARMGNAPTVGGRKMTDY